MTRSYNLESSPESSEMGGCKESCSGHARGCSAHTALASDRIQLSSPLRSAPLKVCHGKSEPTIRIDGPRKQQAKARQAEVFGGLSRAERAEYDARANRIHDVETELELHTRPAEPGSSSDRLAAAQRRECEKKSATDTPQSETHQPYRSRERSSANPLADPLKTGRGKRKNDPDQVRQNS